MLTNNVCHYSFIFMTQCNKQILGKYFENYGWKYRIDDKNIIHSGWSSSSRCFGLKVEVHESLISFEVELFSFSKLSKFYKKSIWDALLRLNRCISVVKLGIDVNSKNVVLLAEIFNESLNYSTLCRILGIFGYYGERIPKELVETLEQMDGKNKKLH